MNATLFSALLIAALTASAQARPITLARGGQPAATIVLPPNSPERVQQAANDLQRYLAKMSGVTLPIRSDGKAVAGQGLYIGACEPTREADFPAANLNPETYAIRQRDNGVFFVGRHPAPTAFAVYGWLEDQLGVRWFAPGDDWEHVPAGKRGELVVDVKPVVSVPDTSPRVWTGHAHTPDYVAWNLRNKTVQSEVVPRRQFQNMMFRIFPPSKYAETHPEYYPLVDGVRWIPPDDAFQRWRPCESNPEVQRVVLDYISDYFAKNPTSDSFSLGMDDVEKMCSCPNCRAWDATPADYENGEFSNRHYTFVNLMAKQVKARHPDKFVGTLIYNIARKLPPKITRLEDNVFGFLTEESAQWYHPEVKAADQELTRQWKARLKHLSRYDYLGLGTLAPRVYPHHLAEQVKFDKALGLEGMYTEVQTFLPNTAPMIWMLAKLQWDSKRDADALLNEFYAKMYGPAAPTMARYFATLERSWNQPRPGREGWVWNNISRQALSISPMAVEEGRALLQEALVTADGDPNREVIRRRIGVARDGLKFGSLIVLPYAESLQLERATISSESGARAALFAIGQIASWRAEREKFWAASLTRPDLLGDTVRGISKSKSSQLARTGQLENGAMTGVFKIMRFYADTQPAQLEQITRKISAQLPPSAADAARSWHYFHTGKPANLLLNGDIETRAANTGAPAVFDHSTAGLPLGWSSWSSNPKGRAEVAPRQGRNGGTAIALRTTGVTTSVSQSMRVKPGEQYFVVAWGRAETAQDAAHGRLSVRFRTDGGAWSADNNAEKEARMSGSTGWQQLMAAVTVPADATQLIILPISGRTTFFDDLGVYRVPQEPQP